MANDMKDTIFSLLCAPELCLRDSRASCSISFNKNGTGLVSLLSYSRLFFGNCSLLITPKLRTGVEIYVFIAAEFDWELKSPGSVDNVIDLSVNNSRKCTLISQFNIELTLTIRVHPLLRKTRNLHPAQRASPDGRCVPA